MRASILALARSREPQTPAIPPPKRRPHFMRAWRDSQGLTLDEMATAINDLTGKRLTGPYLSRIETGKLQYKQDVLEAFARVIGCTPADLLARAPADPDAVWQKLSQREKRRLLRAITNGNGNGHG